MRLQTRELDRQIMLSGKSTVLTIDSSSRWLVPSGTIINAVARTKDTKSEDPPHFICKNARGQIAGALDGPFSSALQHRKYSCEGRFDRTLQQPDPRAGKEV